MFLNNEEIKNLNLTGEQKGKPFIYPFVQDVVSVDSNGEKIASYGLNANSYDIRLSNTWLEKPYPIDFNVALSTKEPVDNIKISYSEDSKGRYFLLPGKTFALGLSMEYFNIPNDVTGFLYCKSSHARLGLNMAPTVLKSGWSGQLVLEFYNQSNHPIKLYCNEGIGTIYFTQHNAEGSTPYNGQYENQVGIVHGGKK